MEITLPLDLVIELIVLAGSMGGMWMFLRGQITDLRRQLAEHGPDVRKISPLETRFEGFRDEMERRLSGIERKVDEVHTLLLRAAATSAANVVGREPGSPYDFSGAREWVRGGKGE